MGQNLQVFDSFRVDLVVFRMFCLVFYWFLTHIKIVVVERSCIVLMAAIVVLIECFSGF